MKPPLILSCIFSTYEVEDYPSVRFVSKHNDYALLMEQALYFCYETTG